MTSEKDLNPVLLGILSSALSSSSSSSSSSSPSSSSSSTSPSSSSSSATSYSSEDEEMLEVQEILEIMESGQIPRLHRVHNFVQNVVHLYSEEEFRRNFRVSRNTTAFLTNLFKHSQHYKCKISGGRRAVTAETQCLSFLWFAGNKNTYREVANLFQISLSTAFLILKNFTKFLFDISTDFIKMPSTASEKEAMSTEFAKIAGFENVIGCIDGCYIYIRKPANKLRSTYINRHGLLSITLQGICGADKKFLDVFLGAPSKIHDSRVYDLSYISKQIPAICGDKYHLLGDAAYSLREYLLTPYKDYGDLTSQRQKYNKKHCQTRVKIENCFGLLKNRFRQIIRLDFFSVPQMSLFILGCCVLHNLCIAEGDLWQDNNDSQNSAMEDIARGPSLRGDDIGQSVLYHRGQLKRDNICLKF